MTTPWHQAVSLRPHWRLAAACRHADPDLFFPIGTAGPSAGQIAHAKEVCGGCPVRTPCLGWALERRIEDGIWGGMTEEERRALRVVIDGQRRPALAPLHLAPMTEPKTSTLEVPGAVLYYDVRSAAASSHPVLLMIGSPMGADGFAALAGHFTDRTVVTYDPRSSGRSKRTDGALETTPDEHADDLHRLISELNAGPVDIFASSGGAVNALVLVARHPEQVRTLLAHEPPAIREAPDSAGALAANEDIRQTYLRSGFGPAMAKFIALVSYPGLIGPEYLDRPAPDPAAFGLPTEDDGSRDDSLLRHNIITCTHYEHDFDALRAASTRVVIGVGEDSAQVITGRTSEGVARRLGTAPVTFPGGHGGFLGDEFGPMGGKPDAFAVVLRDVLDD